MSPDAETGRGAAGREENASAGGAGAPPDPTGPNRAPDLTREYLAHDITVQWYAGRCIHSANCVRALRHVFDPTRRPWVDPAGRFGRRDRDGGAPMPFGRAAFRAA